MIERITVKFGGRSYEKPTNELEISDLENPTDQTLKLAMAEFIAQDNGGVAPDFTGFIVDRFESVANIRPSAQYGKNGTAG